MATSAFKSTTKRSPIGTTSNTDDAGSSNRNVTHRRSRSLSRYSGRFPAVDSDELPAPRGKFVNTVRGSGFPEISLDDIANEFFPLKDGDERESERGRSARRSSAISPSSTGTKGSASQRRGRSVSRQHGRVGDGRGIFDNSLGGKGVSDCNLRRRRSVSVARNQFSDSESDMDQSHNSSSHGNLKNLSSGNYQRPSHQPTAPNRCVIGRSLSQKDLLKLHLHDSYSSHSSALTDDEARDGNSSKNGIERTIRAVYAQKKTDHPTGDGVEIGLYEAMRKELRHAVEEIRTELEQAMVKTNPSVLVDDDCLQSNNSDVLQAVAMIRKDYTSKLEQSEKRKQDLLAEAVVEEQRGQELSKIVRELLPDPKKAAVPEKPSHSRKRSNDRSRMSKRLTEEAEKYFEDFISNVEDTDISSFDGERSDASSTLGGTTKPKDSIIHCGETETFGTPPGSSSLPVEMDGVILPWLQWETSTDGSPVLCKSRKESPKTLQNNIHDIAQELSSAYSESNIFTSSCGSWSLGDHSSSFVSREDAGNRFGEPRSYPGQFVIGASGSGFDMDEYRHKENSEDLLFEGWRQRLRINSGGLILCSRIFL